MSKTCQSLTVTHCQIEKAIYLEIRLKTSINKALKRINVFFFNFFPVLLTGLTKNVAKVILFTLLSIDYIININLRRRNNSELIDFYSVLRGEKPIYFSLSFIWLSLRFSFIFCSLSFFYSGFSYVRIVLWVLLLSRATRKENVNCVKRNGSWK